MHLSWVAVRPGMMKKLEVADEDAKISTVSNQDGEE